MNKFSQNSNIVSKTSLQLIQTSVSKMRVLFIGDVHIKHNNIQEIRVLTDAISKQTKIDFVVIAGDVLHTHEKIDSQLMNEAFAMIKTTRLVAKTFVLVGNHDFINNQQFLTDCHWMNGMKEWNNVVIVDEPILWNNFVFCPFVSPGRFVEALDRISDWKNAFAVFAHQEIKGCKLGAFNSVNGDVWEPEFPMLISGHIHERQTVGSNVLYPGSVLTHAFGSDQDFQGFSIFSFSRKVPTEQRIELNLASKKVLRIKVGDKIKSRDLCRENKFVVSGTRLEIRKFKKSHQCQLMKEANVKIAFKIEDEMENEQETEENFLVLFGQLVKNESNDGLTKDFNLVTKGCQHF